MAKASNITNKLYGFALATYGMAQSYAPHFGRDIQYCEGPFLITLERGEALGQDGYPYTIRKTTRHKQLLNITQKGDPRSYAWRDGFAWGTRLAPGPSEARSRELVSSPDGLHWNRIGTLDPNTAKAYPLDRDLFLLIARPNRTFKEDHIESCIALGRKDREGIVRPFEVIDLGFHPNALSKVFGWGLHVAPLEKEGWIILHEELGYIWAITQGQSGPRVKSSRLFPELNIKAFKAGHYEPALLAFQTTTDSRFIVATRSLKGITEGIRASNPNLSIQEPKQLLPNGWKPSEAPISSHQRSLMLEAFKSKIATIQSEPDKHDKQTIESLAKFPDIWWFEFNSAKGRFERIPAPNGAPDKLETLQAFNAFRLRSRADGTLLFQ